MNQNRALVIGNTPLIANPFAGLTEEGVTRFIETAQEILDDTENPGFLVVISDDPTITTTLLATALNSVESSIKFIAKMRGLVIENPRAYEDIAELIRATEFNFEAIVDYLETMIAGPGHIEINPELIKLLEGQSFTPIEEKNDKYLSPLTIVEQAYIMSFLSNAYMQALLYTGWNVKMVNTIFARAILNYEVTALVQNYGKAFAEA